MKKKNLLLLAVLAVGAYYLWKKSQPVASAIPSTQGDQALALDLTHPDTGTVPEYGSN